MTETTDASSMLDVDLSDAGALKTLKEDEYKLIVTRADIQPSKSYDDRNNLRVCLEDPTQSDADDIYAYLPIPNPAWKEADPKSHKKGVNRFKDFIDAFGVDMPLDASALIGLTGWALVSEEEDDRDGTMRNGIRRFIAKRK